MQDDEQIRARVERGAKLLDERVPGWVDGIDLERLNLANPCDCILGQQFTGPPHGYDVGVEHLDLDFSEAAALGFNVDVAIRDVDEAREEYMALTEAWRNLSLARRQEHANA